MPIISYKKGSAIRLILYLAIPKTGTQSMLQAFRDFGGKVFFYKKSGTWPAIDNLQAMPNHYTRCPLQHLHYAPFDSFLKIDNFHMSFIVVRNPIDRAKSDYLYFFRRFKEKSSIPTFDLWLSKMLEKYREDPYTYDNHLRPQTDFFGEKIKKVYRFESGLEKVFIDIMNRAGVIAPISIGQNFMPKTNTAQNNFSEGFSSNDVELSKESIAKLKEFYFDDFEKWYPDFL